MVLTDYQIAKIINMHLFEGKTAYEIGHTLEINPRTARKYCSRIDFHFDSMKKKAETTILDWIRLNMDSFYALCLQEIPNEKGESENGNS